MITAQSLHDIRSELISCDTDRLVADDTSQCNDRDTRRTTANINDHITDGLFHVNPDTQSSRHWLMDQVDFFGASLLGTVPDGSFLHFGDAGRYTDHHSPAWREKRLFGVDHLDHFPDHQLCRVEICDNTVLERAHGANALMGLFMHHQGTFAYCQHSFRVVTVECYDTRFIHHYFIVMYD